MSNPRKVGALCPEMHVIPTIVPRITLANPNSDHRLGISITLHVVRGKHLAEDPGGLCPSRFSVN